MKELDLDVCIYGGIRCYINTFTLTTFEIHRTLPSEALGNNGPIITMVLYPNNTNMHNMLVISGPHFDVP